MVLPQRLSDESSVPSPLENRGGETVRLIAKLEIKGPNLVKGVHLEGLRVLGKPEHFAELYYEEGVDELIYMDVVASLLGRNSLTEIVKKTAQEIFIPLTVGGGIRSLEDMERILKAGADKVSLNTAALNNPQIIKEAARCFGSSTIVISVEAKKQPDGSYEAYTDNGRIRTGVEVLSWVRRCEEFGAGEILLTSIDQEGTGRGFDLELTRKVADAVSIPVIACGGAGKVEDILEVIKRGKADAVCIASLLHYHYLKRLKNHATSFEEGNIEFLKNSGDFTKISGLSLGEIKNDLIKGGISCRTLTGDCKEVTNGGG